MENEEVVVPAPEVVVEVPVDPQDALLCEGCQ